MVKRAAPAPDSATKKARTKAVDSAPSISPFGKGQAEHLVKVHEALTTIRGCEIFQDLCEATPLTIKEGGSQCPFAQRDLTQVLGADGKAEYKCGGNFLWIDHTWLCNHRVPFNQGQIRSIQKFDYPFGDPPAAHPYDMHIAVDDSDYKVTEHRGSLQRVSPEEIGHAVLFSVAEAIAAPETTDDVLRRWRKLMLTMPFVFSICAPGDDRFWLCQNLREAMVEHGDSVRRTVRQLVHDVAGFKMEKEHGTDTTLSSEKVALQYKKHMKLARSSEPISKSFVESAVTIYKRVVGDQHNQSILIWCDENYTAKNHPFNSIYALQAVCDRASTPSRIGFVLEGLVDHYRMGFITIGEFTVSRLKDPRSSYATVLVMKMDARTHLLGIGLILSTSSQSAKQRFGPPL
jgi:hypothetical protein